MAITASSTQGEIIQEYLSNLSYDVEGSTAKAGRFIAACRALLVMHPGNWSHAQNTIQFDPRLWKEQLDSALQWLASAREGQSRVHHMSFENFRR